MLFNLHCIGSRYESGLYKMEKKCKILESYVYIMDKKKPTCMD